MSSAEVISRTVGSTGSKHRVLVRKTEGLAAELADTDRRIAHIAAAQHHLSATAGDLPSRQSRYDREIAMLDTAARKRRTSTNANVLC